MVGPARFELATSCTPCKRATRLRYGPKQERVREAQASPAGKRHFHPGNGPRSRPAALDYKTDGLQDDFIIVGVG